MPGRLPLVDWDKLINKPPTVLRNLTKFAGFALACAESYANDVTTGKRDGEELRLPGALLQLGPGIPFSAEMLEPFSAWILGCAFRDAVELYLKHLDDVRDILAICSLPLPPDPNSDNWDKHVVAEGVQFHKWFLRKKLEHLKREYAFVLPEGEL